MSFKTLLVSLLFLGITVLTLDSQAGELKTAEGYVIHYTALNTVLIPPEVARNNQIIRSKNRAMLTVAVIKPGGKPNSPQAVPAQVTAQAVNLTQQLQTLDMRQIQEGGANYYVGEFSIVNEDTLNFTLKVQPEYQGPIHEITFSQQFFVD